MTTTHIHIAEDGHYAGAGIIYRDLEGDSHIDQCSADLGDDVYDAIEAAIAAGLDSVTVGGHNYGWTLETFVKCPDCPYWDRRCEREGGYCVKHSRYTTAKDGCEL